MYVFILIPSVSIRKSQFLMIGPFFLIAHYFLKLRYTARSAERSYSSIGHTEQAAEHGVKFCLCAARNHQRAAGL